MKKGARKKSPAPLVSFAITLNAGICRSCLPLVPTKTHAVLKVAKDLDEIFSALIENLACWRPAFL
ncbi:hypothetical protein PHSC3_001420 [Chlamydiales bacterium STE3]|nr:hypothetical protein PHSC3_001420 [Chlamydiales bacterium STE3]